MRTRRQFPITMCFAATIHKCQGLTLRNALVSTRNLFSPRQGFVAFSRVQNAAGLHLLDLVVDKLKVHITALQKYNLLRASINLPKYPMPARNLIDRPPVRRSTAAGGRGGEPRES